MQQVYVIGGAVGTYLSTKTLVEDSSLIDVTDTIDYKASFINYALLDWVTTLQRDAEAISGAVELQAYRITLNTKDRILEAFSGEIGEDTLTAENMFQVELQPNDIPVVLKDTQNLIGTI